MALFGTNGVRGVANVDMTAEMAMNLAKSIGTFRKGKIAVGRDTRQSGDMLKNAVIAGLLSTGCAVVDLGIAPTPCIQYYVKRYADAGIVITASHNPPEYNGIKGIAGDGTEMSRQDEAVVEKMFYSGAVQQGELERDRRDRLRRPEARVHRRHHRQGRRRPDPREAVHRGRGYGLRRRQRDHAVPVAQAGMQSDHAERPGGRHLPRPQPRAHGQRDQRPESGRRRGGAQVGIAHDADADRAVFIDDRGRFVNEDVLLALITQYKLRQKPGTIVTPVSSSSLIEDIARQYDSKVIWTMVGSIHVARKMMEVGAVFGGEGNGGLIFPEFQYCRDGGMSAATMLEMLAKTGKKLSDLVDAMPSYHSVKEKIKCKDKDTVLRKVEEAVQAEKTDLTDGIKVFRPEGWVLVRASGTEPIIRVFAESRTADGAKKMADYGVGLVDRFNK